MSISKLQTILLSSVLALSTAPYALSQAAQKDSGAKSTKMQKEMAPSQDEIKKAQQALKDKGMYTGAVDGTMNADFEKSIRDYQEANKLKATGKLDHATMMKLGLPGEHHEGKGTEMKKEGTATKPSTGEKSGTTPGTETKKKGGKHQSRYHSSEKVKEVQTALQEKGFNPGPIDGIMGAKTTKALASFQRQQNLYANGKLDDRTERELGIGTSKPTEVPGEREKPAPMPPNPKPDDKPSVPPRDESQVIPPVPSGADRKDIGTASSVEDIRAIQMALKNRGYDPGEINGMVSSQTQEALRNFQAANNLPVTGVLDTRTQAALGVAVRGTTKPDVPPDQFSYENDGGPSSIEAERAAPAEADVSDRLANATEVITDLTKAGDRKIPDELLARADAIAVIPHVVKGAFGIGGRYGKGVVVQRLANGRWSAPAFITIGGGSFGAQIGVSATDLVLVFTDRNAVDTIAKGTSLKLGADAAVVAGPVGRTAEAGVTHDLKSGVYAYSRSKGLFAGIALDGAVLDIDKGDNRDVYGTEDARTILSSDAMAKNAAVRNFVATLDRLIPAAKPTR
jgi:lipid-binding SYLF domain-containing protein